MSYAGNRRLDYTRMHATGPKPQGTAGAGKHAGKGIRSMANGTFKPKPIHRSSGGQDRWDKFLEEEKNRHQKGAEEVIQAILLWLKEGLSPMIKRAINFNTEVVTTTYTHPKVIIGTNSNYTPAKRHGEIGFTEDKVVVECTDGRSFLGKTTWTVGIDYADPELFEKLQLLLSKFYNGQ